MSWTYRYEYVRCGKRGCKGCPHGPYWYRYQHVGKRMRKEYIGKFRPEDFIDPRSCGGHSRFDDIFDRRSASDALALEILGLTRAASKQSALKRYRELVMTYHPDRGGDEHAMKHVTAAWTWLKDFW